MRAASSWVEAAECPCLRRGAVAHPTFCGILSHALCLHSLHSHWLWPCCTTAALNAQACAEVASARQQLHLLEAEGDGARIRAAAEAQATDTGRSSLARERAAVEEQRRGVEELLRQLEAREDAIAQVRLWARSRCPSEALTYACPSQMGRP